MNEKGDCNVENCNLLFIMPEVVHPLAKKRLKE